MRQEESKSGPSPRERLWKKRILGKASKKHCSAPQQAQKTKNRNNFKVIGAIGQGSFGSVALAVREGATLSGGDLVSQFCTSNAVALKVIPKRKLQEHKDNTAMVHNEIRVLQKVRNHPFLLHFCYSYETASNLIIATEYCPGGELFNLLSIRGRFSALEAKFYVAEIALALDFLHSHNIIYRDLKPENIALDIHGHIRLIDFGLSAILDTASHLNSETGRLEIQTRSGTLFYSAPEILMRKPHSFETDWWSLGVLMHEMVFGYLPWYSEDETFTAQLICCAPVYEPVPEDEHDSLTLEELEAFATVDSMLQKDPKARMCYYGGLADLKASSYLHDIDWHSVETKAYPAPWMPSLSSLHDVSNFDLTEANMATDIVSQIVL